MESRRENEQLGREICHRRHQFSRDEEENYRKIIKEISQDFIRAVPDRRDRIDTSERGTADFAPANIGPRESAGIGRTFPVSREILAIDDPHVRAEVCRAVDLRKVPDQIRMFAGNPRAHRLPPPPVPEITHSFIFRAAPRFIQVLLFQPRGDARREIIPDSFPVPERDCESDVCRGCCTAIPPSLLPRE